MELVRKDWGIKAYCPQHSHLSCPLGLHLFHSPLKGGKKERDASIYYCDTHCMKYFLLKRCSEITIFKNYYKIAPILML